ncbi:MAG: phosphohistidine phosphatase [Oleiphilaceae bacterium]|jgi:phosphohistidine phosphatase
MKLFIGRHGQASFNAESDRARPLTAVGITETENLLDLYISELKQAQVIWASDLTRANETACIYADKLDLEIETKNFLSPDCEAERVVKKLHALEPDACVLIVSHQPLVGELVSLLCEGNIYAAHPYVTSEIVVVECEIALEGMGSIVGNFQPARG